MPADTIARRIESRLAHAEVAAPAPLIGALTAYLELLARWNQKINLTAFDLTSPSDAAIDRLIVEPVEAARFVRAEDRLAIDIGSGGGSPALPFRLAAPRLRMTLVEARTRKSAFLREAVRVLELTDVEVGTFRFAREGLPERLTSTVDLVTMRGVKVDAELMDAVGQAVSRNGQMLVFGLLVNSQKTRAFDDGWKSEVHPLKAGSDLTILSHQA